MVWKRLFLPGGENAVFDRVAVLHWTEAAVFRLLLFFPATRSKKNANIPLSILYTLIVFFPPYGLVAPGRFE